MLPFIAIFITNVFGVIIYDIYNKNNNLLKVLKIFMALVVISNVISSLLVKVLLPQRFSNDLVDGMRYDITFFIRYCLFNIVVNTILIFGYIMINKIVKFKIVEEENEKIKKSN